MNKERINRGSVSSTPQLSNLESSPRRNSTGKVTHRDKVSQSQIDGKVLPNYLRASTSSCHDICKYGKEHIFRARERRPTFSKPPGDVATAGNQEDTIKSLKIGSGRRLSIKTGTSLGSTTGRTKITDKKVLAHFKEVKPVELAETIEKKPPVKDVLSSEQMIDVLQVYSFDSMLEPEMTITVAPPFEETCSDDVKIINPDSNVINFDVGDNVHEEQKLEQSSPLSGSLDLPQVIKVETAVVEKTGPSDEFEPARIILASGKPNVMGNLSSADKSLASAIRPSRQTIIHGRKQLGSDGTKVTAIPTQRRVKPAVTTLRPSSVAKGMSGKITADKKGVGNLHASLVKREGHFQPGKYSIPSKVQTNRSSDLKSKGSLNVRGFSLRGQRSAVIVADTRGSSLSGQQRAVVKTDARGSSLRSQQKPVAEMPSEKVEEKTLYVIEPKQNSEALIGAQSTAAVHQSPSTSQSPPYNEEVQEHEGSECHYTDNNSTSQDDNEIGLMITKNEKKIVGGGKEHPQERSLASIKLKFRRGKVVNLQSESSTPRKLRFRRGTVLGNSPDVKWNSVKRSSGKKEQSAEDSGKPGPKPSKVVLRHQDAEQKEIKGLFNHVIEETASKLVETRKSKVKALVGAFETVISLQEKKPVVPTT